MHVTHLERMFEELKFFKLGREIAHQAGLKVEQLRLKIAEREARIQKVCDEHQLSAADLYALAQQRNDGAAYRAPVRDVPAGVSSALARESQQVESEREQVRTLGLLIRNVDREVAHELSFDELAYLQF